MVEKQVLFRIDDKTLAKLDKRIAKAGYRTRNEWFNQTARLLTRTPQPSTRGGRK